MFYINENTSDDDVIEEIIKRLCTDYQGNSLRILDFCCYENRGTNPNMVKKVYSKMIDHDICTKDDNTYPTIEITAKGIHIHENMGWIAYINDFEAKRLAEKKESKKTQKWGLWGSKSTVFGTFVALVSAVVGIATLFIDNKQKDVQIKELKDSLIIEKRAYQLLKVAKEKKSSKIIIPVQKHDSLGHTTK